MPQLVSSEAPFIITVQPPINGSYGLGSTLNVTVLFSDRVQVQGNPRVRLRIGSFLREANYLFGSGSNILSFSYTVQNTDLDLNGIELISPLFKSGADKISGPSGTSALLTYTDSAAPLVLVNGDGPEVLIASSLTNPTNATLIPVSFTFDEPVTGLQLSDISVTNGTVSNLVGIGASYTFNVIPSGQGVISVALPQGLVVNTSGSGNDASSTFNITFDSVKPFLTLEQATLQSDPSNGIPIEFDLIFSEPINETTFTAVDVTQAGSATGVTWAITKINSTNFKIRATAVAGNGSVVPTIAGDAIFDLAGNGNIASLSIDNSVTFDTGIPLIAITAPASGAFINLANQSTFMVSGTCSENGRLVVISGAAAASVTCSANTWAASLNLSALGQGAFTITANHSDLAGNIAVQSSRSFTKDTTVPTVALNQAAGQTDPVSVLPISFTVVFSEVMTVGSFTTADITQSGTASGITWNLVTSDNITFTLTATAITAEGTVIPSIVAASTQDLAGNNNASSSSTDNSVDYDTTIPTVAITSPASNAYVNPANQTAFMVSGTCSEEGRLVVISGSAASTVTCTSLAWTTTLNLSGLGQGPFTLDANHSDASGNNAVQSSRAFIKDTVAPTVTVNQSGGQADPSSLLPLNFTVAFIEAIDPSSFTTADITQSGTASGITWTLATSDNITFTLAATAITADGTVIPSLLAASIQDLAANNNTASTSADNSVNYDTTVPTVALTAPAASSYANLSDQAAFVISGICSENGRSVVISGAASATATCTSLAWTATLNLTAIAQGSFTLNANHSNASGINAVQSSRTFIKDTILPTVSINQTGGQVDPASTLPISFTAVFSEALDASSFTAADIVETGSASGITWSIATSDNITFTVTATAVTGDGFVVPTIPVSSVTDLALNLNSASTSTDNSVDYDNSIPTVVVTAPASNSYVNSANQAAFVVSGICSENGRSVVITGATSATVTCTSLAWTTTLNLTATAQGSFTLNANHSDASGNNAVQSSRAFIKDTIVPLVTLNQSGGQVDPASTLPISFTAVFSEAVDASSFTAADIVETGSASGITWSIATSDNITFTVTATAVTGDGFVVPIIPVSSVTDLALNLNSASTSTDNSVDYDNSIPTVAVTAPASSSYVNSVNQAAFVVSGTCSENGRSVVISGAAASTVTCTSLAWTTTLNLTATAQGSFTLNANHSDASGNNAVQSSRAFIKDSVAPAVTINQLSGQADPAASLPLSFDVTFSEAINPASFTSADITQSGTASGITWNLFTLDNIAYTLTATAITSDGTVIPSFAGGVIQDPAGNSNTLSLTTDNSVTYDNTVPTVAITSPTANSYVTASNMAAFVVSGTCSENGRSVVISGAASSTVTCTSLAWTTTLNLTALAQGSFTLNANHSDASGNIAVQSSRSFIKDTVAPTVSINQSGGQADPTSALPVSFTVVFSEVMTTGSFTTADITQSGTASGITWNLATSDQTTYTLTATAITTSGTVIPSIALNTAIDLAGNNNTASTSTDNSVTFNIVLPTVAVTAPAAGSYANLSNQSAFVVSGTCSENSRSVVISGAASATVTCSALAWSATLNLSGLGAGAFAVYADHNNASGNNAIQATRSFIKDAVAPSVTVNQSGGQADPTATLPISFTFVFSEAINPSSFIAGDITQSGTAAVTSWGIATADNITFTVTATAISVVGTVIPSLGSAAVLDPAGNNNTASTSTDNSVTYTVPPTVAITSPVANAYVNIANQAAFPVSGTCSENGRDVVISGAASATVTCSANTWTTNPNLTALVQGVFTLNANLSNAGGTAATQSSRSFQKDTAQPTLTIVKATGQASSTSDLPVNFTITFNEPINPASFTPSDISQLGSATGITWSLFTVDNITYTLSATAVAGTGTLRPRLLGSLATDTAGNNNTTASATTGNAVTYSLPSVTYTPTTSFITTTNQASFVFSGTCSGGGTVTISGAASGSTACSSGSWSVALNLSALGQGNHTFYFNLTTPGGATAPQTSAVLTKDSVVPTVAINFPVANSAINDGNQNAFTVSGTCSENGRIVTIAGAVSGTATCSSLSWSTSLDFYSIENGTVTVTASHMDAAGNSSVLASISFIKNTTLESTFAWSPIAAGPTSRWGHMALWTGTEMIIFGGKPSGSSISVNTGSRYNLSTNTWTAMSVTGAPVARSQNCYVWTGQEMFIWGGYDNSSNILNSGARYNPTTDTWSPVSSIDFTDSGSCAATWTGTHVAVVTVGKLRLYNPSNDTWSSPTAVGYPLFFGYPRIGYWNGKIAVFGGSYSSSAESEGSIYDVSTNTWTPMNLFDVPPYSYSHSALTVGSDILVYGGIIAYPLGSSDLYRFSIATNTWSKAAGRGYRPRLGHTAVWTGSEMMVYGGTENYDFGPRVLRVEGYSTGWRQFANTIPLYDATAVWAGDRLLIFGGFSATGGAAADGYSFKP